VCTYAIGPSGLQLHYEVAERWMRKQRVERAIADKDASSRQQCSA